MMQGWMEGISKMKRIMTVLISQTVKDKEKKLVVQDHNKLRFDKVCIGMEKKMASSPLSKLASSAQCRKRKI